MELRFIDYKLENYLETFVSLLRKGSKRFLIRGFTDKALVFATLTETMKATYDFKLFGYDQNISSESPHASIELAPPDEDAPGKMRANQDIDAVIIFTCDNASHVLNEYRNCSSGLTVIAPETDRYWNNSCLYFSSIPKAGTHLLLALLKSFGYSADVKTFDPNHITNGQLYFVTNRLHGDSSDLVKLRSDEEASRHFLRRRMVFIYRDPRDVAVSMLHFWTKTNHPMSDFLSNLPAYDDRLLRLITGIPITKVEDSPHTIRDQIMNYACWMDLSEYNVSPVKFEDLIGPLGGGEKKRQIETVWKLQLALHVPGNPEIYADQVYNVNSPSFRLGKIGSYKQEFKKIHYDAFNALNQDFMKIFGYL